MEALEITSAEIYEDLSPEVEAMVQGMRRTAQSGTFDRTLTIRETVTA